MLFPSISLYTTVFRFETMHDSVHLVYAYNVYTFMDMNR